MNMMNNENETPLDQATSARLSRLTAMPVDTSRVAARLRAELSPQRSTASWFRPVRAVAASFIVLAMIGAIVLTTTSRAVLASPQQLARVHEEMVAGHATAQVNSIDAAQRTIAADWPQAPALPEVPPEHVMACCMKPINNKKTACVLLKSGDVPVTMMVANAKDVRMPKSRKVVSDGGTYHVEASGAINMVMTEQDGRWLCLMGALPETRLIQLAAKLTFKE